MKRRQKQIITNIVLCMIILAVVYVFQSKKSDRATKPAIEQVEKSERQAEITTTQTIERVEIPELKEERAEIVVGHSGYTVSFNTEWRIPNWVAYELTMAEVQGEEPRSNRFVPDPFVVESPTTDEYKNSGYDRGHMAPAADMKWSKEAMRESFYTTNICPQNKNSNKGDWKDLEEHVRSLAQTGPVCVACGPIVGAAPKTIGVTMRIVVPDELYKVLLRPKGDSWVAIGFVMPNAAGHKPLSSYAMSVDEVEAKSGIDFFVALPDSIEERIEAAYELADWGL